MLDPRRFLGRSPEQVREFLDVDVADVLERHSDALSVEAGEVLV
jgi:hypothetical protein